MSVFVGLTVVEPLLTAIALRLVVAVLKADERALTWVLMVASDAVWFAWSVTIVSSVNPMLYCTVKIYLQMVGEMTFICLSSSLMAFEMAALVFVACLGTRVPKTLAAAARRSRGRRANIS